MCYSRFTALKGTSSITRLNDASHLQFMQEVFKVLAPGIDDLLRDKFNLSILDEQDNLLQVRKNYYRDELHKIVSNIKSIKAAFFEYLVGYSYVNSSDELDRLLSLSWIIQRGDSEREILSKVKSFVMHETDMPNNVSQTLFNELRTLSLKADEVIALIADKDLEIANIKPQESMRVVTDNILMLLINKLDSEVIERELLSLPSDDRLEDIKSFLNFFESKRNTLKSTPKIAPMHDSILEAV